MIDEARIPRVFRTSAGVAQVGFDDESNSSSTPSSARLLPLGNVTGRHRLGEFGSVIALLLKVPCW